MPSFLFALMAAAFASIGGRDQWLMAHLSAGLGRKAGLLFSASFAAMATCAAMAAAGIWIAGMLSPGGKLMLVAFALVLAAVELAWPIRRRPMAEPTMSLFAVGLVVAAQQVGDGARFLVFAIAAATGAPWLAAIGGAMGSIASLYAGWALGADFGVKVPLRAIRLALSAVLVLAAGYAAASARGIVG